MTTWSNLGDLVNRQADLSTTALIDLHHATQPRAYSHHDLWTFELQILGANGWTRQDLEALLALVQAGQLTPVIDRGLPLTEAREAVRLLEERSVSGKVIVVPYRTRCSTSESALELP